MKSQYYFTQIERPTSQKEAANSIYLDPDHSEKKCFNTVNGLDRPNAMLYPGHSLIIPSLEGTNEGSDFIASLIREQTNFYNEQAKHRPVPRLFNQHFTTYLYGQMQETSAYMGIADNFQGIAAEFIDDTLKQINNDLGDLNKSYMATQAAKRGVDLPKRAPRMSLGALERSDAYARIQKNLSRLPKQFQPVDPKVGKPKDILAIRSKDVKAAFKASGTPGEIKKISKVIQKSSEISRSMGSNPKKILSIPIYDKAAKVNWSSPSLVKGLGHGLQAAGGAFTVYEYNKKVEAAKRDNPESADIIAVHEGGKAIGSVAGGFVGGKLGTALGTAGVAGAVLLLGTPIGWGAVAIIGIATVAGGFAGSYVGSELGSEAAERSLKEIDPSRAGEIDMIINGPDAGILP